MFFVKQPNALQNNRGRERVLTASASRMADGAQHKAPAPAAPQLPRPFSCVGVRSGNFPDGRKREIGGGRTKNFQKFENFWTNSGPKIGAGIRSQNWGRIPARLMFYFMGLESGPKIWTGFRPLNWGRNWRHCGRPRSNFGTRIRSHFWDRNPAPKSGPAPTRAAFIGTPAVTHKFAAVSAK